jgi:catechol-2,3-dioxygenase
MQLATLSTDHFTVKDISKAEDFFANKLGFVGVESRPVNGDWVITAERREAVVARTRKTKESTPSDPADAD